MAPGDGERISVGFPVETRLAASTAADWDGASLISHAHHPPYQSAQSHDSIQWEKRFRQLHGRHISHARRPDQSPQISPAITAPLTQFQDQPKVFCGFEIGRRSASKTRGKFTGERRHRGSATTIASADSGFPNEHVLHQPETNTQNATDPQRARAENTSDQ